MYVYLHAGIPQYIYLQIYVWRSHNACMCFLIFKHTCSEMSFCGWLCINWLDWASSKMIVRRQEFSGTTIDICRSIYIYHYIAIYACVNRCVCFTYGTYLFMHIHTQETNNGRCSWENFLANTKNGRNVTAMPLMVPFKFIMADLTPGKRCMFHLRLPVIGLVGASSYQIIVWLHAGFKSVTKLGAEWIYTKNQVQQVHRATHSFIKAWPKQTWSPVSPYTSVICQTMNVCAVIWLPCAF